MILIPNVWFDGHNHKEHGETAMREILNITFWLFLIEFKHILIHLLTIPFEAIDELKK